MPDAIALRQIEARRAISTYIEGTLGGHELTRREVLLYAKRKFSYGWEVLVQFPDRMRRLHVLIGNTFPFSVARIGLVDRPEFLTWPHVEKDGLLCLHPDVATWNVEAPLAVVQRLLEWAIELVTECMLGKNQGDFRDEFNSYWNWAASDDTKEIKSLLSLNIRANREIAVWRGKTHDYIGETPSDIRDWLTRRFSQKYKLPDGRGALVWIREMPIPREYPRTANDLLRLLGTIPAVLLNLIVEPPDQLTLVLASPTRNGTALAGMTIERRKQKDIRGRKVDSFSRGFRPGTVPQALLPARYFTTHAPIARQKVKRIDHSWIHGRDSDTDEAAMKKGRVVVVGCGSLGAPVAVSLAQAGIGSITLVDPDHLSETNISRHPLGADNIGNNKSEALMSKLELRFPHLDFSAIPHRIQESCSKYGERFNDAVVINATGDWATLVFIEKYFESSKTGTKVLNSWLEPHASAGHAIFSPVDCAPLSSAFTSTGEFHFAITCWPKETEFREPACGATFSPYGAADTLNSVALVANMAIDLVCNRIHSVEHRIWINEFAKISGRGGTWSTYWQNHIEFSDRGGLVLKHEYIGPGGECKQ